MKIQYILNRPKYDVLSRNSLILFKKSVPEVLPHFSEFATLGLEELHIFSISAVDRNKEKKWYKTTITGFLQECHQP